MTDLEKAKEWLGRQAFEMSNNSFSQWELIGSWKDVYTSSAWLALVAVHGEESAKMVLLSKWSEVKGGQP